VVAAWIVNEREMDGEQKLEPGVIDRSKSELRAWDVYERCQLSWATWRGYNPQGRWGVLRLVEQPVVLPQPLPEGLGIP